MIGNYIKAVAPSVSRTTAQLMKTGQTTSYRTGDDGDLEAGRSVSFTVLAENNPFGNTNRFTSEFGTQTYTNNIIIDWSTYDGSTVLGYYKGDTTNRTWNNTIDWASTLSIGGFTSGWRLSNFRELINICNISVMAGGLNYAPFNFSGNFNLWTSSTSIDITTNAWSRNAASNFFPSDKGSNSYRGIPCRTFTVTGTTLS